MDAKERNMKIDASVVFYLLSKDFAVDYDKSSETSVEVTGAELWDGSICPQRLYIVGTDEDVPRSAAAAESAFVYCSETGGTPRPRDGARGNAAYIVTPCRRGEVYGKIVGILYSLQEWDCRMKDACSDAANLHELMAIAREVLDYSFSIVDRNLRNIAYSPDFFGKFKHCFRLKKPSFSVFQTFYLIIIRITGKIIADSV